MGWASCPTWRVKQPGSRESPSLEPASAGAGLLCCGDSQQLEGRAGQGGEGWGRGEERKAGERRWEASTLVEETMGHKLPK